MLCLKTSLCPHFVWIRNAVSRFWLTLKLSTLESEERVKCDYRLLGWYLFNSSNYSIFSWCSEQKGTECSKPGAILS